MAKPTQTPGPWAAVSDGNGDYREAAQYQRFSESWYAVQPRIATAVQVWRLDNTLRVVK